MNRPAVALFGGTFDPVHEGHLALAAAAVYRFGFRRVHFLVEPVPPHKAGKTRAPAAHRFAMVSLATMPYPEFVPEASDIETTGPTYTVRSLPRFCKRYGLAEDQVVFLAGGDSLRDLPLWREWESLCDRYRLLFFARRGVPLEDGQLELPAGRQVADLRGGGTELPAAGPALAEAEIPEVSSTAIRSMLQCGRHDVPGLPPAVAAYIFKTGVYTSR